MITIEQTKKVILDKLDELTQGLGFKFYIHTNEGAFQQAIAGTQRRLETPLVNGVIFEQSSQPIPLKGLDSLIKYEALEFCIPVKLNAFGEGDITVSTGGAEYALEVLGKMCNELVGYSTHFEDANGDDYACVLGISTPSVGQEQIIGDIGVALPVSITLAWQLVKDGITTNDVTWTLDGTPITPIDGSIARTVVVQTNNYLNDAEMRSRWAQQGITFKFVIPYKNNGVSATLVDEMLGISDVNIHALIYNDTRIEKYYSVIATDISAGMNVGKNITLNVSFVLAKE